MAMSNTPSEKSSKSKTNTMTGKTVVKLVKLVKKLFNNDEVTNF
jgi:hypothetical protein